MCALLPLVQKARPWDGGIIVLFSYKSHLLFGLTCSNDRQLSSGLLSRSLHCEAQFKIAPSHPNFACPGLSPGRGLYPSGQSLRGIHKHF